MKMIKKFIEYLRGIFSENVEVTRMLVTDECPETACKMQENKVYVEEYPCTPDGAVSSVCEVCGQDPCVCEHQVVVLESVDVVGEEAPVAKKRHRGRPRKRSVKKD